MLSTMALPNEYTVTWNIGNFGHLIKAIIGIEIYNLSVVSEGADTHDVTSGMHGMVDIIHPYESSKIKKDMKVIKPFFEKKELKFLPIYLNHYKNKSINIDPVEFAQTYWNHEEPKCDISYNIDMTNFFNNTDIFINNLHEFLQLSNLKQKTVDFIMQKKQNNVSLYNRFNDIINNESKDLTPLERGVAICYFADGDYNKVLEQSKNV